MQRVLFLCTGNSARSQMAEAFLRKYAGEYFEAHSAGLEPKGVNPFTIQVMQKKGSIFPGKLPKESIPTWAKCCSNISLLSATTPTRIVPLSGQA